MILCNNTPCIFSSYVEEIQWEISTSHERQLIVRLMYIITVQLNDSVMAKEIHILMYGAEVAVNSSDQSLELRFLLQWMNTLYSCLQTKYSTVLHAKILFPWQKAISIHAQAVMAYKRKLTRVGITVIVAAGIFHLSSQHTNDFIRNFCEDWWGNTTTSSAHLSLMIVMCLFRSVKYTAFVKSLRLTFYTLHQSVICV